MPVFDFHTHTTISDGHADALEMARRCQKNGYAAYVCSDHVDEGTVGGRVPEIVAACRRVADELGLSAIPAVEVTRVAPERVARVAAKARSLGALLVVVHGETLGDFPQPGLNLAATSCSDVDILGHPGLITPQAAEQAQARGIHLEISAAGLHGLTNGHVARVALEVGASLVLDSDAHRPESLLTPERAQQVLAGSGLSLEGVARVAQLAPLAVLARRGIELAEEPGALASRLPGDQG
ncbi:MAG TPA: histidinol phosphate phosphatase domain-containing protein [Candidatus Dormibacteraeota bacterium]|nr:histidinol phosphate phosphatase domain-containing protein [Candidatus Dormibacteraeota bacterium]